jgi:hypothetical protein
VIYESHLCFAGDIPNHASQINNRDILSTSHCPLISRTVLSAQPFADMTVSPPIPVQLLTVQLTDAANILIGIIRMSADGVVGSSPPGTFFDQRY